MDRWKTNLYLLWFSQVLALMSMSFGIPFIPYFIQELGIVEPDKIKLYAGLSSAAPALGMAIVAPFWGMLADRYGKKIMILRAVVMGAVILFTMSLCKSAEQLMVLRFFQGVFTGTISASNAFIASNTPDEHLSYSFGVMTSANFIGLMIGPSLGGIIADRFGYRTSFVLGSATLVLDFFLIYFILKEAKIDKIKVKEDRVSLINSAKIIFKPPVITLFSILFLLVIVRSVFTPYLALFIQETRGMIEGSAKITGLASGFAAVMTATSAILLGKLGRRFNKLNMIKVSFISGIVMAILLISSKGLTAFILLYGLMMLAIGGVEAIMLFLASQHVPSNRRGGMFGFLSMQNATAWMLSTVIGSYISIKFSIRSILFVIPFFLLAALYFRSVYRKKFIEKESI